MGNIAYCGLNCEACSFRRAALERDAAHLAGLPDGYAHAKATPIAELELCSGCKADRDPGNCEMKKCAMAKGYSTCADCPDMPCKELAGFCADAEVPHHNTLDNLRRIREIGEEAFEREQESRWRCACGRKLSWYLTDCQDCIKK